jgi:hypothetical protein
VCGVVEQVGELGEQSGIDTGAVMTKGPQRTRGGVEPIDPGEELLAIGVGGGAVLLPQRVLVPQRALGGLVEQPRG